MRHMFNLMRTICRLVYMDDILQSALLDAGLDFNNDAAPPAKAAASQPTYNVQRTQAPSGSHVVRVINRVRYFVIFPVFFLLTNMPIYAFSIRE